MAARVDSDTLETFGSGSFENHDAVKASGSAAAVTVPDSELLMGGNYSRTGQDLNISNDDDLGATTSDVGVI